MLLQYKVKKYSTQYLTSTFDPFGTHGLFSLEDFDVYGGAHPSVLNQVTEEETEIRGP